MGEYILGFAGQLTRRYLSAEPESPELDAVHAENQANARLIAAAPELLDALRAAIAYLKANRPKGKITKIFSQLNEYENAVMKPALSAIAKATGKDTHASH